MANLYIGAHVSASGGVQNAPLNAAKIGANAFALFTGNPRGWSNRPLKEEEIKAFKANMATANLKSEMVVPHDTFLINLASPKEELAEKSYKAFIDEIHRAEQLGLTMLNFHPGSPSDSDPHQAMLQIASYLKRAISESNHLCLVLEATAGQGHHLGRTFEELSTIIEATASNSRVGVCLDTCHIFAAGYDIRDEQAFAQTMAAYDHLLGRQSLKAMHLNDSMKALGSRVDRHQPLGDGFIGLEAFKFIAKDLYMQGIPLILETTEPNRWPDEIEMMRGFAQ